MNRERIYIGIFIASLLAFIIFEWAKPRPIDWTESYSGLDKIPFGCYIMRDILPNLFEAHNLNYQNKSIYTADWDSTASQNTIYINGSFAPDKYEAKKLIQQAEAGHRIFISAKSISGKLADTLGIDIDNTGSFNAAEMTGLRADTVQLNFTNPQLQKPTPWTFRMGISHSHFSDFDSVNTTILGRTSAGDANYIMINKAEGSFFLHTTPQVFTNYHMLDSEKAHYAFKVLSYLPVQPTTWDEYYKLGRKVASSPMRYIVSHAYLRWGWITALAGLFLFIIFRAKRRQRIIPDIQKPKNTSLAFAKTIGRLYYESGDRKNIAQKKITYFLAYIRSHLRLDTETFDATFVDNVANRSGIDRSTIAVLFDLISDVQQKSSISSAELQTINNKIEHFYQQTSR